MHIQPAHHAGDFAIEFVRVERMPDQAGAVTAEGAAPDGGGHEAAGLPEEGAVCPVGGQGADQGALWGAVGDGWVEGGVLAGGEEGGGVLFEGFGY